MLHYFNAKEIQSEESVLYIQTFTFDKSTVNSLEEIMIGKRRIIEKLSNEARLDEENKVNFSKVVLYNKPQIFVINVDCDKSMNTISIMTLITSIPLRISIEEIYIPKDPLICGHYIVSGIVCSTQEKEYISICKTNTGWKGYMNENIMSFIDWESVVKWIILEQRIPTMIFYELNNSLDYNSELTDQFIKNIYEYTINNTKKILEERPLNNSHVKSLDYEEDNCDLSLLWSCKYCDTTNSFPSYNCLSISVY